MILPTHPLSLLCDIYIYIPPAAVYYTPEILKQSGWNEEQVILGTLYLGICKLGGEIVAFFLLDRIGRR